jgi:hypothetical protein
LISLGPSILAAGITTLAGASIMLFTEIYFWRLFAYVLFFSIIQAIIGSFVVFLVLTECIGPSHPTFLVDSILSKCDKHCQKKVTSPKVNVGPNESPSAARPVDLSEMNSQRSVGI